MGDVNARAQLLDIVRQVRRRWRIRLAVQGAVGFLIAGVAAMIAIAYVLESLKFAPTAILVFRIVTALVRSEEHTSELQVTSLSRMPSSA